MKRHEEKVTKMNCYMSVKKDGEEIYVEDIVGSVDINAHLEPCRKRLAIIRKCMPQTNWSITIERRFKKGEDSYFQILDVETGELQEQVL